MTKVKVVIEVEINARGLVEWAKRQNIEDTTSSGDGVILPYVESELGWLNDSFDTVSIISMEIL